MAKLNPYLTFNGNCKAAFNFYKSVFGGDFTSVSTFKDMPQETQNSLEQEDYNKIMHISLPIGEETTLMGSDITYHQTMNFEEGNNFSISIAADSKEEADTLFNKLVVEGEVGLPLQEAFWGSYFGMLTDQYGIQWMINFDEN